MSKVRTALLVLRLPAWVTVTVRPLLTGTLPIEVEAKFTAELAEKTVLVSAA
jgi:hypothetical protein